MTPVMLILVTLEGIMIYHHASFTAQWNYVPTTSGGTSSFTAQSETKVHPSCKNNWNITLLHSITGTNKSAMFKKFCHLCLIHSSLAIVFRPFWSSLLNLWCLLVFLTSTSVLNSHKINKSICHDFTRFLTNGTLYLFCHALNFVRTHLYIPKQINKSEFNRET